MHLHTCTHQSPLQQARDLKTQGNALYKEEKFEEAAKCYEEAIRLSVGAGEKDNVVAIYHQNLGAVYDAMVRGGRSVCGVHLRATVHICRVCMHVYFCTGNCKCIAYEQLHCCYNQNMWELHVHVHVHVCMYHYGVPVTSKFIHMCQEW